MVYVLWVLSVGRYISESEGTIIIDPCLVILSH
jgi:hypothetical protein